MDVFALDSFRLPTKLKHCIRLSVVCMLSIVLVFSWSSQAMASDINLEQAVTVAEPVRQHDSISAIDLVSEPLALPESIQLALEHDPDIQLAELTVKRARLALSKVKDADKALREMRKLPPSILPASMQPPFSFEQAVTEKTMLNRAKNAVQYAETAIKIRKQILKSEVEKAFYEILKNRSLISVSQKALARAEEQLSQTRTRFDLGLAAKSDVLSAEVQVVSAQVALSSAERALEISMISFNNLLGIPMNSKTKLTGVLTYEPIEIDLEASVESALMNRLETKQAQDALSTAKDEFEVASKYYTPNVYDYQEKELGIKEAEIGLERATDAVELSVRLSYSGLKIAESKLHLYDHAIEQAAESLRLATLLYQEGLGTVFQVSSAQTALAQIEFERVIALFDYNVSKAQFNNALGVK